MKKLYILVIALVGGLGLQAKDMTGLRIYINPGHGGWDSDDRNVAVAPFAQGDTLGFWESSSNLHKGLMLRELLEGQGATVAMSRVLNRTEDDLNLNTISREANEFDADLFFSIHSNATGTSNRVNFPMMLFKGYTENPAKPEDKVVAKILFKHLIENQVTYWTQTSEYVVGDWDFYPDWNNAGLGVLRNLTVTGFLSEGSYHDYVPETYRLLNMDYKYIEAWHFAKAVMEYFNTDGFTTGHIAGVVYDSRMTRTESYVQHGRDKQVPLCGATVTLLPNNITYTTDPYFNGVYMFRDLAPGNYQLKVVADDHYEQTIDVTVTANTISYTNVAMDRVRSTPPEVLSYSPMMESETDSINCTTPIVINFNWDMDVESVREAFSIEPAVEGEITFEDSQYRMVFTPNRPYEVATRYTVTIDKSAKHPGNLSMEEDFSFSFLTQGRNQLKLLASSPADGGVVHYTKPTLEVRFDNVLDAVDIRNLIKLYDNEGNEVSINLRSAKYNQLGDVYGNYYFTTASDLVQGQEYQLRIDASLSDVNSLPVIDPIVINFTAGDVRHNDAPIEDFETADRITYDAAQSSGVSTAKAVRSTSQALFGSAGYNFTYTFNANEAYAFYPTDATFAGGATVDNTQTIGMHIYGDLACDEIWLQLSSGDDTREVLLTNIDFRGWQFREARLDQLTPGKSYRVSGIKVVRKGPFFSNSGSFYLDNMLAYTSSGIQSVATSASIQVYPNPATDLLHIQSEAPVQRVALYNLAGSCVATGTEAVLDVTGIPAGTYLLQIRAADHNFCYPVLIVH